MEKCREMEVWTEGHKDAGIDRWNDGGIEGWKIKRMERYSDGGIEERSDGEL